MSRMTGPAPLGLIERSRAAWPEDLLNTDERDWHVRGSVSDQLPHSPIEGGGVIPDSEVESDSRCPQRSLSKPLRLIFPPMKETVP